MIRRIGSSTLMTEGRIPLAVERIQAIGLAATAAGADEVRRQLVLIFENQGNGQWPPNEQSTIDGKGEGKLVMEDTRQLLDGIRIIPLSMLPPVTRAAIGWDDTVTHTAHGPIGMASLADIHDRGFPELGIPARPWISQFVHSPEMLGQVIEVMVSAILAGRSTLVWTGGVQ